MGGKDAIIVDADADLDKAVDGVLASAFGYQGQKCSACSRAIVDAKVYDEFLDKLAAKAKNLKMGPSDDPGNYMGPVISAGAKKIDPAIHRDRASRKGGVIAGGDAPQDGGYFMPPTIIADVDSKARVFQEEIFGPVLAVTKARDFEHALELANDSQYGLTGAVFSNNPEHLRQAREQFHVGQPVLQPEVHGGDGGRASVRRVQYVGDGLEGGRSGLPAAVRAGEVGGD